MGSISDEMKDGLANFIENALIYEVVGGRMESKVIRNLPIEEIGFIINEIEADKNFDKWWNHKKVGKLKNKIKLNNYINKLDGI